jgi:hypothetical protein
MGYIHRAHHCVKPRDGRPGDIWECDECRTRWLNWLGLWVVRQPKRTAPAATETPE